VYSESQSFSVTREFAATAPVGAAFGWAAREMEGADNDRGSALMSGSLVRALLRAERTSEEDSRAIGLLGAAFGRVAGAELTVAAKMGEASLSAARLMAAELSST